METGGISHDEQDIYEDLEDLANKEDIENRPSSSDSNPVDSSNRDQMCQPGSHQWQHDMCMICTVCQECTGYSISCLSSMRPDRKPGQLVVIILFVFLYFSINLQRMWLRRRR